MEQKNPCNYNLNKVQNILVSTRAIFVRYFFDIYKAVWLYGYPTNVYNDNLGHWYPMHWQHIQRKHNDNLLVDKILK